MEEVTSSEGIKGLGNTMAGRKRIHQETFVDIDVAFVFGEIACGMRPVQHSPDVGPEAKGVRQDLESGRQGSQAPSSCSLPTSQSLGCAMTFATKAFAPASRRANSARV